MAGIGFELRQVLQRDTYSALLRAYAYAGLISSGPWVLSIVGIMLVGVLSLGRIEPEVLIVQFLVSVTYLIAGSLILTGPLQLLFTRFVADRLFEQRERIILPNLLGAMTLVTAVAGTLAVALAASVLGGSLAYRILMVGCFVTLSNLWLVVIFLTGLKSYHRILGAFALGYGLTVVLALALPAFGLEGLLAGFLAGQVVLVAALLALVVRDYPAPEGIAFDFLRLREIFVSLAVTGLLYNVGIWADKLAFWFNPVTSEKVIEPLRASVIYDLPIFLAYLAIIPGMATFLVRVETDFADNYQAFYRAVREGDTLERIFYLKDQMVFAVRQGLYEIFKVQGVAVLVIMLWGEPLLRLLGISTVYLPLFRVDLVGVSAQVVLLAILNVLFYLDERPVAAMLAALFAGLNLVLTWVSQALGPAFYGYGFAVAVSITAFTGVLWLNHRLDRLEYETFMLQS